jgi:hypothetical protein
MIVLIYDHIITNFKYLRGLKNQNRPQEGLLNVYRQLLYHILCSTHWFSGRWWWTLVSLEGVNDLLCDDAISEAWIIDETTCKCSTKWSHISVPYILVVLRQPITKQQISNMESSHVVAAKLSSAVGVVIEISKLFAKASDVIGLQGAVCNYFHGSTGRLTSVRIYVAMIHWKKKVNRELWIVEHSVACSHGVALRRG